MTERRRRLEHGEEKKCRTIESLGVGKKSEGGEGRKNMDGVAYMAGRKGNEEKRWKN